MKTKQANQWKVLLCFYTIGLAGCSTTRNSSYMDNDIQTEQTQVRASPVTMLQDPRMQQGTFSDIKHLTDQLDQINMNAQQNVERRMKFATDTRTAAEILYKTANEKKKDKQWPEDSLYNKALTDSLSYIKRTAAIAENIAIDAQKELDRAIQDANDIKIATEISRKLLITRDKQSLEDSVFHKMLTDSMSCSKRTDSITEDIAMDTQIQLERAMQDIDDTNIAAEMTQKLVITDTNACHPIFYQDVIHFD